MKLFSDSITDGQPIAGEFAFAVPHPTDHVELSGNRNPHLAWSDLPAGTKSLAILCVDPDVPTKPDDVNQEGRTVPADLPRTDFYH
ncbi:MAG: phospholipid-binding protein, partial [Deltaproteobacteria bacterium]